tara:strand:- start:77 stop:721 length:645 start_codon:yes stop_codon:yes gene_type:complete
MMCWLPLLSRVAAVSFGLDTIALSAIVESMAAKKKRAVQLQDSDTLRLKVETLTLRSLKAHPKNPRTHPKKDSDKWNALAASLKSDYFDPLVFNTRNSMLVSGHLRKKVLLDQGIKKADVVIVDYDESTHVARMIAANNPTGENNDMKLSDLVGDLKTDGFDHSLAGMTLSDVDELLDNKSNDKSKEEKPPDEFDEYGDKIPTSHECPKCNYVW